MKTLEQFTKDLAGKEVHYDYQHQAWVVDGVYQSCNHAEEMECDCFGRIHAGEKEII